jgi:hypothetical protein
MENTLHIETIKILWKRRHVAEYRRSLRAILFTLKARRDSRRMVAGATF